MRNKNILWLTVRIVDFKYFVVLGIHNKKFSQTLSISQVFDVSNSAITLLYPKIILMRYQRTVWEFIFSGTKYIINNKGCWHLWGMYISVVGSTYNKWRRFWYQFYDILNLFQIIKRINQEDKNRLSTFQIYYYRYWKRKRKYLQNDSDKFVSLWKHCCLCI